MSTKVTLKNHVLHNSKLHKSQNNNVKIYYIHVLPWTLFKTMCNKYWEGKIRTFIILGYINTLFQINGKLKGMLRNFIHIFANNFKTNQ